MNTTYPFIAHVRKHDKTSQPLLEHLQQVAQLAEQFAAKIGLPTAGRLLGLLHDIGKYSSTFQNYIRGASGLNGEEQQNIAEKDRGKIDHATSGAQIIWDYIKEKDRNTLHCAIAQTLASCIAAHHSRKGLFDYITHDGTSPFIRRITTSKDKTFLDEIIENTEVPLNKYLSLDSLINEFYPIYKNIEQESCSRLIKAFYHGLLIRFLFSCLIDADRLDTANFETPYLPFLRNNTADWSKLITTFEQHLTNLVPKNLIDSIRTTISQSCLEASRRPKGSFTLNVPTGGGKTLASLRFALHHAQHHKLDRIIYIIPFTTIIDQNAQCVRDILGDKYVLEHHSNILYENDTWRNRALSENWDAPIIFTTMVQFLDTLFSAPTSDIRRMHQMANSLLIFDEIQTLPIKTVHLFNNAINFLVKTCGSSVVLCTATQPLLHKVNIERGAIQLNEQSNIIANEDQLFQQLQRNIIKDHRKTHGWTTSEVTQLAQTLVHEKGNVLIVVNTKTSARTLYLEVKKTVNEKIYHLSTAMCPTHRKKIIQSIKDDLQQNKKIICISTQLIEAGVDLDFGAVIRYLAGLDSIAQSAGRCNRNARQTTPGPIYIVNPAQENLEPLPEIRQAQEITQRLLDEFKENPTLFDEHILSPRAISKYFEGNFTRRSEEMVYPWQEHCNTNLLELLSENKTYKRTYKDTPLCHLHAFSEASMAFHVIDKKTRGILVPYDVEGKTIIAELASSFTKSDYPLKHQIELLRRAQQYSVNIFPPTLKLLEEEHALYKIQNDADILYLDERYYSEEYGVTSEINSLMSFINI